MSRIPGLRRWFHLPVSARTVAREIDDEVGFHIESRVDELVRSGISRDDARSQAIREFGDVAAARSELAAIDRVIVHGRRRAQRFDAIRQDVGQALRAVRREPGFVLAVVLTLGLGIGLNAAMFGITDRLLFRPPAHVAAPEAVKRIYFTRTWPLVGPVPQRSTTYADYQALRAVKALAASGAYFNTDASVGRGHDARKVKWSLATATLFPTLGVKPHLGRFYTEAEDVPGKGAPVIVLGYAYWQREFGGERSVLGRQLRVGNTIYEIIGVAPRGFNGVELEAVDLFVPMSTAAAEGYGDDWSTSRNMYWLRVVGRMKAGATRDQFQSQATVIHKANNPDSWGRDSTAKTTAESIILAQAPHEGGPGLAGRNIASTASIAFWLSGVSLIVLAIACANVINLLLARAARRRREVGIRLALGISRARLVGQSLIETLLLAAAGGLAGLALANWGGALIRNILLTDIDWSTGAIDRRVLAYTLVLVLACALVAALAPALQSLRTNLVGALKSGVREGGARSRTRSALVVLQTMLCVVLLTGSGLFVRSLLNLRHLDKGFDAERVVALYWHTGLLGVDGSEADRLYRAAAARIKTLPAVENSAVGMTVPFWSAIAAGDLRAEGWDSLPQVRDGGPYYNGVTPEYFATMGTRIVRGRSFTERDGRPGQPAAIVSQTMARILWPNQNPLGKCLYPSGPGREQGAPPCSPVVGVAKDALRDGLEGEVMQYYLPLDQVRRGSLRTLFFRVRGDPVAAMAQVRQAVQGLRPDLPYADTRLIEDLMEPHVRPWHLGATLFTAFGVLALLLAAVGLYGIVTYTVAQRTHEMSVRMALGAGSRNVLALIVGHTTRIVAAGLLLGLAGALFSGLKLAPLLFHVSPRDPAVYTGVSTLLLLVALFAALVPAARALRISPIRALRED